MDGRNYWEKAGLGRRVSRRGVIRGASVAGAGLAGAALIGCGGGSESTPTATATATSAPTSTETATATATVDPYAGIKRGGTYKSQRAADPPTIDPYGNLSFQTKGIAAVVYSRLYKIAARADANPYSVGVEPDAAVSAESADGQHWTVKINPAVKFQNVAPVNGRPMTSEDVVESYNALAAPDSPGKDLISGWSKVEAVDDSTVNFTLASPSAVFLDDLADTNKLFVIPKEGLNGGFDPATTMIGSGPWILDNYTPAVAFKFKKNPDWYDQPKPFLDGFDDEVIPEYANRLAQFQAGNSHSAGINANDVLTLRKDQPDVQWRGVLPALLSFIYFSPEDMDPDAPWRDVRFRQGVSMATDRDALTELGYNVKALQDAGLDVSVLWNNLIPAGWARWWLDPQSADQGDSAKYFKYDVAEAKKMIEASGYDGSKVTYQYTNVAYGSTFNSIAEGIQNYILEAGVNVETVTQDYNSQYITHTFRGDFHGIAFGYETPFPEVGGYFPRMFGPDPANHSRISDSVIDDLAAKQAVELDYETRKGYIWDIQRRNAEMMYYAPNQAGAGTGWTAYRPEVRGIIQTRGYGIATEGLPNYWLDV